MEMARPKSLVEAQVRHDAKRAGRAHLVRLSEDEQRAAERLRRRNETIAALLRRLLREKMGAKSD
jgi:hypothetical protein